MLTSSYFQDTFLKIVYEHEFRASLDPFSHVPSFTHFIFPQLVSTGSLCVLSILDLDECTTGSHSCDVNSLCQNTVGSYTCSCNAGYTGDGKPCNGIYQTVEPSCETVSVPISGDGIRNIITLKFCTISY